MAKQKPPLTTVSTGFMPYDRVRYKPEVLKGNPHIKKLLLNRGTVQETAHWRQRPSSVRVVWDGQTSQQAIHYTYLEKVSD